MVLAIQREGPNTTSEVIKRYITYIHVCQVYYVYYKHRSHLKYVSYILANVMTLPFLVFSNSDIKSTLYLTETSILMEPQAKIYLEQI